MEKLLKTLIPLVVIVAVGYVALGTTTAESTQHTTQHTTTVTINTTDCVNLLIRKFITEFEVKEVKQGNCTYIRGNVTLPLNITGRIKDIVVQLCDYSNHTDIHVTVVFQHFH